MTSVPRNEAAQQSPSSPSVVNNYFGNLPPNTEERLMKNGARHILNMLNIEYDDTDTLQDLFDSVREYHDEEVANKAVKSELYLIATSNRLQLLGQVRECQEKLEHWVGVAARRKERNIGLAVESKGFERQIKELTQSNESLMSTVFTCEDGQHVINQINGIRNDLQRLKDISVSVRAIAIDHGEQHDSNLKGTQTQILELQQNCKQTEMLTEIAGLKKLVMSLKTPPNISDRSIADMEYIDVAGGTESASLFRYWKQILACFLIGEVVASGWSWIPVVLWCVYVQMVRTTSDAGLD